MWKVRTPKKSKISPFYLGSADAGMGKPCDYEVS